MRDRRELLIANSQQSGGYVQDGLLLFLDGLNQGGVAGKWIDVVDGEEFTLVNATQNADCVSFSDGYARTTTQTLFKTIEIIFNYKSNGNSYRCFFGNGLTYAGIYRNKNSATLAFGGKSSNPNIPFETYSANSYSAMLDNNGYYNIKKNNEIATVTTAGESWSRPQKGTQIGYYNAANAYRMVGDVYALRLYDRELTDAELTQNYLLDKERYGI